MLKYHIKTIEVGAGGATSINFSSIPQDYTDLEILYSLRTDGSNPGYNVLSAFLRLNGLSSGFTQRVLGGASGGTFSFSNTQGTLGWHPNVTATAGVFGNSKAIILNYTSNSNKSFSVDNVSESNQTDTVYCSISSGLWSNTSPITHLSIVSEAGNFVAGSTVSIYGIKRGDSKEIAAISGGTVTTSGGYTYHTFRSSGTFTTSRSLSVDVLVVAGGGSSGGSYSGGGGAGGVIQSSEIISGQTTVVVGAGGIASNGSNSSASSFEAIGGGRGANGGRNNGLDGGSGGGGGGVVSSPNTLGGLGVAGQGNNGGQGTVGISSYELSGGGGGAGAVGGNATTSTSGNGGAGTNAYSAWASATSSGASGYYAGGGAGGHWYRSSGTAGIGGGGSVDTPGTANTGGGGGGRYLNGAGFAGGSGIVIIRYLTP